MATVVESRPEELKPPKKEIEIINVLAEKVRGHVKWYSVSKCYGFICRNDDGGDLFVHRSVISSYSKRFPSLRNGEEVEFNVVETNQGIEATYVTGPGGQPVKGMRPMYRRFRTTSDPNHTENKEDPENADRRPARGPRRRGPGRIRSAGVGDGQKQENGHEVEGGQKVEEETHTKDNGVEGESPNRTVPRQRRRAPRSAPRNRSAPAEGDVPVDHGVELIASGPYRGGDGRGQMRRFRRPFYPRGGSRYMHNGWNPYDGYGMNGYHQQNGYRSMGDRNGFEYRPRRRPYGSGYPRGPRHRPQPTEDPNGPVNTNDPAYVKQDETQSNTVESDVNHASADSPVDQNQVAELENKMDQIKVEDCSDSTEENREESGDQQA